MLNILYLGSSFDASAPVDRRRFVGFSAYIPKVKLYFKEEKGVVFDILVCSSGGDLAKAKRLAETIPKFVFDYANHYLIEDSWFKNNFRNLAGSLLANKEVVLQSYKNILLELMHKADLVVCPSITQEKYLKTIGINAERLTDFFGPEIHAKSLNNVDERSIFWEGQGVNLKQLKFLEPALKGRENIAVKVVSDNKYGSFGGKIFPKKSEDFCKNIFNNVEFLPWSVSNVNFAAQKSILGVIPLDMADSFVAAKPENKLVYMWLLGLPVLCSPTESYLMLEEQVDVKFTCGNIEDWKNSLTYWLENNRFRRDMAGFLNEYAKQNYSDEFLANKWLMSFEKTNIL